MSGARVKISTETIDHGARRIFRNFGRLKSVNAYIGTFASSPNPPIRRGHSFKGSMADLALLMEKGSTIQHIPPRPLHRVTMMKCKYAVNYFMQQFGKKLYLGNSVLEKNMQKLALRYEGWMKGMFLSGYFRPNADSTILEKKSSIPLIDTGAYRQTISSEIDVGKKVRR